MGLLLDTCALLWWQSSDSRIEPYIDQIRQTTDLRVSKISMVEITIKIGIGKLKMDLDASFAAAKADRIDWLDIEQQHLAQQLKLPNHHKDPFDRLIITQAIVENMTIITDDRRFHAYNVPIIKL